MIDVNDERAPAEVVTDPYGPYGRCIRPLGPDGYGVLDATRCPEPACNDLGWCADHLSELQTW